SSKNSMQRPRVPRRLRLLRLHLPGPCGKSVMSSDNVDAELGAGRPIRVLHAPVNVGGHPATLARCERNLGFDSQAIALRADASFPADAAMATADARTRVVEAGRWRLLWRALPWGGTLDSFFRKRFLLSESH